MSGKNLVPGVAALFLGIGAAVYAFQPSLKEQADQRAQQSSIPKADASAGAKDSKIEGGPQFSSRPGAQDPETAPTKRNKQSIDPKTSPIEKY